jgi:hypothetical protein
MFRSFFWHGGPNGACLSVILPGKAPFFYVFTGWHISITIPNRRFDRNENN